MTSTVLIKGTGAHETAFETWAETQKDQWPVELKLLMALPYGSCVWVLCELPGATWTRGLPKTSCLPLLLLKALPSSLLKSPFWLNQPGSISTSYEQRTWNDTQSLPIPKSKMTTSVLVEIYQILTLKPASIFLSSQVLGAQWIIADLKSKCLRESWRDGSLLLQSSKICDAYKYVKIRSGRRFLFGHIKMDASIYRHIYFNSLAKSIVNFAVSSHSRVWPYCSSKIHSEVEWKSGNECVYNYVNWYLRKIL